MATANATNVLGILAPAKINLTLEVLGRRSDGYHGIRSVMVPLELADELTIEPGEAFSFECDRTELGGERNLAMAALRAAFDELPAARVGLRKRIPTEAGLGGGSSDAAAVLRAAMSGGFGAIPVRDWLTVARSLGSDVPFFLCGTAALVEGTGERLTPAGALPPWHVLIVKPPVAVSTAEAYRAIDARERAQRPRRDSVSLTVLEALQRHDYATVEASLQNDFTGVVAEATPEIAAALGALRAAGARSALLCGSGSCVFALAPDAPSLAPIASRLDLPLDYEPFLTRFAATPQWVS